MEAVEIGSLLWQKAGLLEVALPVADVALGVCDVEIAGEQSVMPRVADRLKASVHLVEEPELLLLAGCPRLTGVRVGRDGRDRRAVRKRDVGLDPSPGVVKEVVAVADAYGGWLNATQHGHAGPSFGRGLGMDDVIAGILEQLVNDRIRCAYFLNGDDVGITLDEPLSHAARLSAVLVVGGANPVDVDGGDSEHPATLCRSADSLRVGTDRGDAARDVRNVLRAPRPC